MATAGLFSSIDATMQIVVSKAVGAGTALQGEGIDILLGVTGIMLSWHVFIMILDGSMQQTLGKVVSTLFIASAVAGVLGNWETFSGSGNFSVHKVPDSIVQAAGGTDAFNSTASKIATLVAKLMKTDYVSKMTGSFNWGDLMTDFTGVIGGFLDGILGTLVSFFVAGVLTLMLVAYVLMLNVGKILLAVMMLLGPVFIPFAVMPAASFLFDGWLRMAMTAMLYKLVGWALAFISVGVIDSIVNAIGTPVVYNGESLGAFYPLMLALFWSFLVLYLMQKIPEIASGIAGGASIGPYFRTMPRGLGKMKLQLPKWSKAALAGSQVGAPPGSPITQPNRVLLSGPGVPTPGPGMSSGPRLPPPPTPPSLHSPYPTGRTGNTTSSSGPRQNSNGPDPASGAKGFANESSARGAQSTNSGTYNGSNQSTTGASGAGSAGKGNPYSRQQQETQQQAQQGAQANTTQESMNRPRGGNASSNAGSNAWARDPRRQDRAEGRQASAGATGAGAAKTSTPPKPGTVGYYGVQAPKSNFEGVKAFSQTGGGENGNAPVGWLTRDTKAVKVEKLGNGSVRIEMADGSKAYFDGTGSSGFYRSKLEGYFQTKGDGVWRPIVHRNNRGNGPIMGAKNLLDV